MTSRTMGDKIERTTTFNLEEYANQSNHYDSNKLHPANHKLQIRREDGTILELNLLQLELIMNCVSKFPYPGRAIDALHEAVKQED